MSTPRYVVDSWAWMEFLDGSEIGKKIEGKIKKAEVFTSIISIAEVVSKVKRKHGDAGIAFDAIVSLSKPISGDDEFAREAGLLHANIKEKTPNFSLGDAFTLCTAKKLSAKVLTGDPDFRNIKEAEML